MLTFNLQDLLMLVLQKVESSGLDGDGTLTGLFRKKEKRFKF